MPSCLDPLRAWLTEDVAPDVVGISSEHCLVFIPSLRDCHDLPVVPSCQRPGDDLAYLETITQPKPWVNFIFLL